MLYLFVLGRDSELSKFEVISVLENKGVNFKINDEGKEVVVLSCNNLDPNIIDEFGGIIKIAEVISNSGRIDHIENDLEKISLYNGTKNKIEFYIDAFNTGLLSFLEDYLKDYFKKIKIKALYKRNSNPSKLINKNIIEEGVDFVIFKNYIGKTISISKVKEIKTRDISRPSVDHKKTISIRLAKILINISKAKKNDILLDPFCGSGTILQEALLKNINVIGIDNDPQSIEQTNKNIGWLKDKYNIKNSIKVIQTDCTKMASNIKPHSINAVVTEPYMGPFIRNLPNIDEAKKMIFQLSRLYDLVLKNMKIILKKGSRSVIIIPKFKTKQNKVIMLDFASIVENNGFELATKPIKYGYKENKLLRDIYIIENNQ